MYYPSLEEVKKLASRGNLIPIYCEVPADLETPVSAYMKTARGKYSFLLESVEGGEHWGRYSFMGTQPYRVIRTDGKKAGKGEDPLSQIEKEISNYKLVPVDGLPRFHGGAVGYLAWELARYFEELPSPDKDVLGVPEAIFMLVDTILVFDHLKHNIKIVSHVHVGEELELEYQKAVARIEEVVARLARPLKAAHYLGERDGAECQGREPTSNMSREAYDKMVLQAKEYIYAGDVIQVVLSQRLSRPTSASPLSIYRALRTVNPSPYMYFLHLDDFHIIGSSPELLVRVEDGEMDYHPIAGTRRRGATEEEDIALEQELLADEKERAEHIMLLDLGRNDVGRVSQPGTVQVTQLMEVERYSHVMHLVSHVRGKLRNDLTAFDALRACFPAGTVSGAPKIRAMEIIAELEPDKRGPYAGSVGYISFSGNLDTAITIRTITLKDGVAHVQAGGGIVADSIPANEYEETINKARALLRAIEEAESRFQARG
ncbi:MAG: anthranilate synthase component I [Dehalococcoidia bacterium]|nr:anthranilate synthase component I [Dehalococcoidia bacterium]